MHKPESNHFKSKAVLMGVLLNLMNRLKAAVHRCFIKFDEKTKRQSLVGALHNLLHKLKSNNLESIRSWKFCKIRSNTF